MKALKILFLLPLSMLSLKMTAQIDDLLKNKDITWIAETYNDFLTEQALEEKIGTTISRVTPLKILNIKEEGIEETYVFQQILMDAVKEGKITLYKYWDCKTRLSPNDLMRVDTIMQIDPNTYETKIKLVFNNPAYDEVLFFRARQIVFYDAKKEQFGVRTLAVAPVVKETDDMGEFKNWKPLFWMQVTDLKKTQKLTNDDVTWAARMNLSGGMKLKEENEYDEDIRVHKLVGDDMPIGHLFNVFQQNTKIPFYDIESFNPKMKFDANKREIALSQVDTIMQVDPNTYETKIKVVYNKIESKDIKRLRLIQNWYWNDKKKRLEIYLLATAPLKEVTDEAGEFLFSVPLFYRRTDD